MENRELKELKDIKVLVAVGIGTIFLTVAVTSAVLETKIDQLQESVKELKQWEQQIKENKGKKDNGN